MALLPAGSWAQTWTPVEAASGTTLGEQALSWDAGWAPRKQPQALPKRKPLIPRVPPPRGIPVHVEVINRRSRHAGPIGPRQLNPGERPRSVSDMIHVPLEVHSAGAVHTRMPRKSAESAKPDFGTTCCLRPPEGVVFLSQPLHAPFAHTNSEEVQRSEIHQFGMIGAGVIGFEHNSEDGCRLPVPAMRMWESRNSQISTQECHLASDVASQAEADRSDIAAAEMPSLAQRSYADVTHGCGNRTSGNSADTGNCRAADSMRRPRLPNTDGEVPAMPTSAATELLSALRPASIEHFGLDGLESEGPLLSEAPPLRVSKRRQKSKSSADSAAGSTLRKDKELRKGPIVPPGCCEPDLAALLSEIGSLFPLFMPPTTAACSNGTTSPARRRGADGTRSLSARFGSESEGPQTNFHDQSGGDRSSGMSGLGRLGAAVMSGLGLSPKNHLPVSEESVARLVEGVRRVTEVLIWGETHGNGALFDLFCEHHMLATFVAAVRCPATPRNLRVQVLQSLCILVQNARRETTSFYLFSGGHFRAMLDDGPDLDDEEVLAYFVGLLKGIALRLDVTTAVLFLKQPPAPADGPPVELLERFPMFERAACLAQHEEAMVRTAARTAVLCLLRLDQHKISCVLEDAFRRLLAPALARAWHDAGTGGNNTTEAEEELQGFLVDLVGLQIAAITEALEEQFDKQCIDGRRRPWLHDDTSSFRCERV
eukprot:TRINITY_DN55974_c0_g1_i1.p1 TRINITY_DN55974_c0_g1~~TRINITY_DN55974_c0_g1_i1.p1  ORF type:complete len:711 (-),score=94.34 TRINITY_DN55974_c0_g1_i1:100-2232(-)